MPFDHLADFLDHLHEHGRLTRIRPQVSSDRELAGIVDRVVRHGDGSALLFENVDGKPVPVVANLLGTRERLLTAAGVSSLDHIADRVAALVSPDVPSTWLHALRLVPRLIATAEWPPRRAESAVVQQVVLMGSDVDLTALPVPVCWPGETLPAFTGAHIVLEGPDRDHSGDEPGAPPSRDTAPADARSDTGGRPDTGGSTDRGRADGRLPGTTDTQAGSAGQARRRLISRAAVQVADRNSLLIHWTPHDASWHAVAAAAKKGQTLPVALVLGSDPLLTLAADLPLPEYTDTYLLAGFLRRQGIAITQCRSIHADVPADAEIVLEAIIDPAHAFQEAPPVAAPTGFLTDTETAVRATVTAVTHRANPVLPVVVPNRPPGEEAVLAEATERILLPLVRLAIPDIVNLRRPAAGAYRHIVFASIRKQYAQQALKVMNALWGLDRLATAKLLVIVDHDVDVASDTDVWFAVGAHAHPGRDTVFSHGPADMLDHAAPRRGGGHRMGIDATRKLPEEDHPRHWPAALSVDAETQMLLETRWTEFGLRPADA